MITQNLGKIAITPKGQWVAGTYERLDMVTDAGSSYISLKDNNVSALNTADWMLVAEKGDAFVYTDFTPEQLASLKGDTGTGIQSIVLTSTVGLVKTYTITLTDGTTATFSVEDGEGIDGKSAYQVWLDLGNVGTEQDFIDSLAAGGVDLSSYAKLTDLSGFIETEADPVYSADKASIALKSEIPTVPTKVSELANDSGFISSYVETDPKYTSEKSTLALKSEIPDITGLATKAEIPTVPTTVSSFTNDAGYLTTHIDISGKVDKVTGKSLISDTEINRLSTVTNQTLSGLGGEATANKQNSLTADGTGTKFPTVDAVNTGLSTKQATLVSATNIKTVNGQSLVGSGDLTISGDGSSVNIVQATGTSTMDVMSQKAVTYELMLKADRTEQFNYLRLYGKTCCVLGDSFIAGDYFAADVCNLLNMAMIKNGYGGYCITDGGYGLGSLRSKIDEALATNADVFIFEGGLNDWYYSAPIGNETDSVYTTYYGALNYIANKFATCGRNIAIIPINLQQRNTSKQSGGAIGRANFLEQENYANIFKRVFEKYGIKTCDVFHDIGITYENASLYTTDGVHPNAAGRLRWKNYLTQWILSNATVPFDTTNIDPNLVTWNILGGFDLSNNVLTSKSGSWTGSAYSTQTITVADVVGLQSEIRVEYHPLKDGIMFGLSIDNLPTINPAYNAMDYGFYIAVGGNNVKIYENGSIKYSTTKTENVKLQIKVNDKSIQYYIDDVLSYTSLSKPTIGNTYKVVATSYYKSTSPATLSNVKLISYL